MENKLQGCLIGAAVGDSLGLPYEGMSSSSGKKLFGKNKPPSGPTLNPNTMTWNQPTNMNTGSSVFGNSPMSPTTVATKPLAEDRYPEHQTLTQQTCSLRDAPKAATSP